MKDKIWLGKLLYIGWITKKVPEYIAQGMIFNVCEVTSVVPVCDPRDCSPPGSSVHGILQARTLEWVAMPSSVGSF